jgi:hypothetical protein
MAYENTEFGKHLGGLLEKEDRNIWVELMGSGTASEAGSPYPPSSSSSSSSSGGKSRKKSISKLFGSSSQSLSGLGSTKNNDAQPPHILLHGALNSGRAKPLAKEVQKLRVVKSERELKVMKIAGDISSDAHTKVGAWWIWMESLGLMLNEMNNLVLKGHEICISNTNRIGFSCAFRVYLCISREY